VLQNEQLNLECGVDIQEAGSCYDVMSSCSGDGATAHEERSYDGNTSAVAVLAMDKHATSCVQSGLYELQSSWYNAIKEELGLRVESVDGGMHDTRDRAGCVSHDRQHMRDTERLQARQANSRCSADP